MGFFDKINGKGIEDKVEEYSEVYGEVLLGLHRDLEKYRRLLNGFEKKFDADMDLSKKQQVILTGKMIVLNIRVQRFDAELEQASQHRSIITDRMNELDERITKQYGQIADGLDSVRAAYEEIKSWPSMQNDITDINDRLEKSIVLNINNQTSIESQLQSNEKQVRQLRLFSITSFAINLIGLGVVVWLIS